MLKTQLRFIITVVLVLGFSISLQSLFAAWQAPSANPPSQPNIHKPINEGNVPQTKGGGFTTSSNLGVGGSATIVGTVNASSFIYTSDRRLKENIITLDNPLSKILLLEGVEFDWKDSGEKSIGLIAQDVEKVFPELVHTSKGGIKSLEYGNLVSPLIEAVKEQQKQIEELKKRINEIENK